MLYLLCCVNNRRE